MNKPKKPKEGRMLKLFVENQEVSNPTVMVRWCVDAKTFNKLRDEKVSNPSVLIVVYNVETKREYRFLEKLSDLICFIPFRTPGENRIFGTICWNTKESNVSDRFLAKDGWIFNTTVLRDDRLDFLGYICDTQDKAMVTVHVDAKLFPAKSFDWKWVNLFWKHDPEDQCAFRKRRILAYTAQPLVMLVASMIFIPVMSVAALCALIVGRIPDWSLLNPFNIEGWNDGPAGVFKYQPWYFTKWYAIPFRPIFPLLAGGVGLLIGIFVNATSLSNVLITATIGFVVVVLTYVALYILVYLPSIRNEEEHHKKQREEKLRRDAEDAKKLQQEIEAEFRRAQRVLCNFVKSDDPMAIPAEAKTVKLRFNGIKRRVCRPFAA